MMREPTDDPDAILAEFVLAYWGAEAGPYIMRVVDTLTAAVRTCPGGHANTLCRILDWTHISRLNHSPLPGDDGEYPKPWLNVSVVLDCAELLARAVAATPAASKHRTVHSFKHRRRRWRSPPHRIAWRLGACAAPSARSIRAPRRTAS